VPSKNLEEIGCGRGGSGNGGLRPGWLAQWEECLLDPEQKISRPRQLYVGYDERPYVPMDRRSTLLDSELDPIAAQVAQAAPAHPRP
jgi:citrate synthase